MSETSCLPEYIGCGIDDLRRLFPVIVSEVGDDAREATRALLTLAELLNDDASTQTITDKPTNIIYDLYRCGNEVGLVVHLHLTGDYKVIVTFDNVCGEVTLALTTTFDVDNLWFRSLLSEAIGDRVYEIDSTRPVASFEWNERFNMRAMLAHAVEQAEYLVLQSFRDALLVDRETV